MPRTSAQQYPRSRADLIPPPIVGVDDTLDWNVARPGYARELLNLYIPPGPAGQRVTGRPGLAQLGAQLGSGGARTMQFLGQFIKSDDTRETIAICGGKFYTLNWSTSTWTETLTAAHLSGASITLSTTARVHSVTLNDKIVFWDGTNDPWMWDGTAGGGLTELTNAEVFTGPGAVYYAKLFGLFGSGFYWSEEGDPTTGYATGGYNNAWEPLGAGKFTSIAASNTALYVAEARRIIRITGPVADDFQTSGTRSDVSEKTGTISPMLVTDNGIVFLSADGAPYLIRGGLQDLWRDCQVATSAINTSALDDAVLMEWPVIDAVLIGVPMQPNSVITEWLVFRVSQERPAYIGRWDLGLNDTGAVVLNGDGVPTVLVSGNADGYVYQMGQPTGTTWSDAFAGGTEPIAHTLTWQPLGADADTDRTFDRMTVILDGAATAETVTARYQTTRATSAGQTRVITGASGALLGSTFVLGTSMLSIAAAERRLVFGIRGYGRWIAPTISHSELGKTFGVKAVAIESYPWGTGPQHP